MMAALSLVNSSKSIMSMAAVVLIAITFVESVTPANLFVWLSQQTYFTIWLERHDVNRRFSQRQRKSSVVRKSARPTKGSPLGTKGSVTVCKQSLKLKRTLQRRWKIRRSSKECEKLRQGHFTVRQQSSKYVVPFVIKPTQRYRHGILRRLEALAFGRVKLAFAPSLCMLAESAAFSRCAMGLGQKTVSIPAIDCLNNN